MTARSLPTVTATNTPSDANIAAFLLFVHEYKHGKPAAEPYVQTATLKPRPVRQSVIDERLAMACGMPVSLELTEA